MGGAELRSAPQHHPTLLKPIMRKITQFFVLTLLSAPLLASAVLVPCNGLNCDFAQLVELASKLIDYALVITIPISTCMFAYAGFLYISSSTAGNIEKAHTIFRNVLLGLFFVLGAWLIVKTILVGLGAESYGLLNI